MHLTSRTKNYRATCASWSSTAEKYFLPNLRLNMIISTHLIISLWEIRELDWSQHSLWGKQQQNYRVEELVPSTTKGERKGIGLEFLFNKIKHTHKKNDSVFNVMVLNNCLFLCALLFRVLAIGLILMWQAFFQQPSPSPTLDFLETTFLSTC